MSNAPPTLVSPQQYIQNQFALACEELGVNPQETVLLVLFDFLRITPEDRGLYVAELKKAFNKYAEAGDFEALEKTVTDAINTVELQLYDSLTGFWEDQDA